MNSTQLQPGEHFEQRFEVVRFLGLGTTGAVYHVRDTSLDHAEFALKVIHRQLLTDPKALDRVRNEMSLARRLNHPNILRVHECVLTDNGNAFLVSEYVEGVTLAEVISQTAPLDGLDAAALLHGVAAGLEHAHRKNIIHRDLKPENILVSHNGEVKICDFGLAELVTHSFEQTKHDLLSGTPLYMSPEQFQGARADSRSDLYALGVIAYELAAGVPPFEDVNLYRLAQAHICAQFVPLEKVRPSIPQWYSEISGQMMSAHPAARPDSLTGILETLRFQLGAKEKPLVVAAAERTIHNSTHAKIKRCLFGAAKSIAFWTLIVAAASLPVRNYHSVRFRFYAALLAVEQNLGVYIPGWRTFAGVQLPIDDWDFPFKEYETTRTGRDLRKQDRMRDVLLAWMTSSKHINIRYIGRDKLRRGSTLLMWLTQFHDDRSITILIERGVDINAQDVQGNTALHYGVTPGNEQTLIRLLEKKPDLFILNRDGKSAFHNSIKYGYASLAELMLQHAGTQASKLANFPDSGGITPLQMISRHPVDLQQTFGALLRRYGAQKITPTQVTD